jgi:hypothetical protein
MYMDKRGREDTVRTIRGIQYSHELLVRSPPTLHSRAIALPAACPAALVLCSSGLTRAPPRQVAAFGRGQRPALMQEMEKLRGKLQEAHTQAGPCWLQCSAYLSAACQYLQLHARAYARGGRWELARCCCTR